MSSGMWTAFRSWKNKGTNSPLKPREGMQPPNLFPNSDAQNCRIIHLCSFKLLGLWKFVTKATGN
jgi:hypothetical protein